MTSVELSTLQFAFKDLFYFSKGKEGYVWLCVPVSTVVYRVQMSMTDVLELDVVV